MTPCHPGSTAGRALRLMGHAAPLLGILLATVAAPARAQPAAPAVRVVEELRLDATAEDFPTVGRIFVGPQRQIVVPISQDRELRVYDAAGRRITVFGRNGEGPGEFRGFGLAGWIADTMWVTDPRLRRTTFIAPDYSLLRTVAWAAPQQVEGTKGSIAFFDPLLLGPNGASLGQALLATTGASGDPERRAALIYFPPSGPARLVYDEGPQEKHPWTMWYGGFGQLIPFVLSPQHAFAADGSRMGRLTATIPTRSEGTFTLTIIGITGDTLLSRTFPFRGEPIPRQAIDSALAAFIPKDGRSREGPADLPQRFQQMARERMPPVYTPVESIVLGLDRTVWVGLRPSAGRRGYLILNRAGDPIGTVSFSAGTRVRQASATHVWVTETDEDGLASVVRYRVVGLTCGAPGC